MATVVPFVPVDAPTGVRRGGGDLTLTVPGLPPLVWLPLVADGGPTFPLAAPVTGTCRTVAVSPALAALPGVASVLGIAPLPFGASALLRGLPAFPTFWFAASTGILAPPDDHLFGAGEHLGDVQAAWIGLQLADRVTLAPAVWVELFALAATGLDAGADVARWRTLHQLTATSRSVRVLDHVGRPLAGRSIRLTAASGTTTSTTGPDGVIALPPGDVQLRWDIAQPVHASYERSLADPHDRTTSTKPGDALLVPAGTESAHVQLLDTAAWFASRPPQLHPGLGHVHPDSRLEPLVDGIDSFRALLADLRAATGAGHGAHFAGWSFNDFPLDPAHPEQTMFVELVRALRAGGVDAATDALGARFLMDKYLEFRPGAPIDDVGRLVVLALMLGVDVMHGVSIGKKLATDTAGFLVSVGAVLASWAAVEVIGLDWMLPLLEDAIDGSEELAAVLNAIRPHVALRSRHPALIRDVALQLPNPLPIEPSDFIDGTGSYHQKFQVVRRAGPGGIGNRIVGYVGGIDINRNRLDTHGHSGSAWRAPGEVVAAPSPQAFHDVHARVTGPAAADIAATFAERWDFDVSRQPDPAPGEPALLGVAFPTPEVNLAAPHADVPREPARHLVQVGRSGYRPAPNGGVPLPWSPQGEATIAEAIHKALDSAQEYIYIEDQYFTPPDTYISALLRAAARTPQLRLVIVVPTSSDQLFGDIRRRDMFSRLHSAWGERMVVGAPIRRPVLAAPGRVASTGRLRLLEAIGATTGDVEMTLGPRARLPGGTPFWMWVEGEQMLAVEKREDLLVEWQDEETPPPPGAPEPEMIPARRYLVRRTSSTDRLWGARTRSHRRGAPVTLSQTKGIYVHTKVIIVDDVFVGIGSCNTNRRGFYHDGEITAFAVPEQLKAARENPARALRTALWAEHLGLPPAMGGALLADPVAAVELFRRSTLLGNRISSFAALPISPEIGFPSESAWWLKVLAAVGVVIADDAVPYAWNTFIDPPTGTDPAPVAGPAVGPV